MLDRHCIACIYSQNQTDLLFIGEQWKTCMMSPSAHSHRAFTCGSGQTAKASPSSPTAPSNYDTHCTHLMLHYTNMLKEMLRKKTSTSPSNDCLCSAERLSSSSAFFPSFPTGSCSSIFSAKCVHVPTEGDPSSVLFSHTKASHLAARPHPREPL